MNKHKEGMIEQKNTRSWGRGVHVGGLSRQSNVCFGGLGLYFHSATLFINSAKKYKLLLESLI